MRSFVNFVKESRVPLDILRPIKLLLQIYALSYMAKDFGHFVASKVISADIYQLLIDNLLELYKQYRPMAVTVADAWGFPDFLLISALGRYDGNVYETLLQATRNEPLNKRDVSEGYYRHIQYILHPERKPQRAQSRL